MTKISLPQIGLFTLLMLGLLGLFFPQFVPKANAPYDKVMHFVIFALTTCFAVLSFRSIIVSALFAVAIFMGGVVVEIVQAFGPDRQPEIMDIVTNFIGVFSAFFLTLSFRKKHKNGSDEDHLRKEVLDLYQEEKKQGTPVQVRLEKAARLYRRSRPEIPPAQVRLLVSEIVEKLN